ncbi:NAD(P)H-dependent oxidoreductase [Actinospica robiniae]|uniref:NAD(P)H-dependent oxidoreductase n=1 Tax=Actinospica robiniae TaxID=304901 RepID=UPI000423B1C1|nr:NAD(P)H-dependent oxidoreductase [Actinospica robiniae]
MRILLILDHPYTLTSAENIPHRRSFTAAVAAAAMGGAARAGHQVDLIDLAADDFSPAMNAQDLAAWRQGRVVDPQVLDYQQRLLAADHLVFAFPVWWEAMPAATKGFLDRVLTKGVVFDELPAAKGNPFRNLMPRLGGVTVLSIMTTPHAAYRWWYRDPLTKILFKGTFAKIGVKDLTWVNYDRVTERDSADRQRLLRETEQRFAALKPRRTAPTGASAAPDPQEAEA